MASGSGSLNAVVGWPKDEWGMDPTTYSEMRPGAYDVHERVRDMNRNGILASMCFPSIVGFSEGFFQEAADHDLSLNMTQAYNDWHIDEWAASYPGRFIPLPSRPFGTLGSWRPKSGGWPRRGAGPRRCPNYRISKAFPAITTRSTGTPFSALRPKRRW